tara:strand:+ start:1345 stop:1524 length:180 start_codon:yes stop_codon:yes gene_type:complete
MTRLIFSILVSIMPFGCAGEQKLALKEGKGGIQLGVVFRVNEVMDIRILQPLEVTEEKG